MRDRIVKALYQRLPGLIEGIIGCGLPVLVHEHIHHVDVRQCAFEVEDVSKQAQSQGFWDPRDGSRLVDEVTGVDLLSQLEAVPLPKSTSELDNRLQRLVPTEFVEHEPAEREVPTGPSLPSNVPALIRIEEVHPRLSFAQQRIGLQLTTDNADRQRHATAGETTETRTMTRPPRSSSTDHMTARLRSARFKSEPLR